MGWEFAILAAMLAIGSPAVAGTPAPDAEETALPLPLTLAAALRWAEAHSPDIAALGVAPELARAAADAARSSWLPTVSGSVGFGYGNDPRARVGDGQGGSTPATNLGAQATVPLVNVQAWSNARAAGQSAKASDQAARFAVEQALAEVAARYVALQRAEQGISTAEARLAEANALLVFARDRVEIGVAPRIVATRAELAAKQEELRAMAARTAAEAARVRLAQGLGLALDGPIQPEPASAWAMPPSEALLESAITTSRDRPEIRAVRARVEATRAARQAAMSAWIPTIAAVAQWGENRGTNAFGIASGRTVGAVSASVSLPLYGGGLRAANLDAARANERAAELALTIAERAAETALRLAWRNARDAHAALAVAGQAAALARDELDRAENAWKEGVSDHLAVAAAQTSLAVTAEQREAALAGYNLAVLEWERSRGAFPASWP